MPLPHSLDGHPWSDVWARSGWRVQECLIGGGWRVRAPDGTTSRHASRQDAITVAQATAPSIHGKRAVIVLHGLGRTRLSMLRVTSALEADGFAVADLSYPSLTRTVQDHAEQACAVAQALVEDGAVSVDLVGHSLGGLVARQALAFGVPKARRLACLGTPNQGARIADALIRCTPLAFVPCGTTVTTAGAAVVPPPSVPTLVVAGGNGRHGWNPLLAGDNDGVVSVAETRLGDAEATFVRVRSLHSVLMSHPKTIEAVLAFLGDASVPDVVRPAAVSPAI